MDQNRCLVAERILSEEFVLGQNPLLILKLVNYFHRNPQCMRDWKIQNLAAYARFDACLREEHIQYMKSWIRNEPYRPLSHAETEKLVRCAELGSEVFKTEDLSML